MRNSKKPNRAKPAPATQEEAAPYRLRFRGKLLELVPTTEYPIVALQTETFEAWIEGLVDLKTSTRISTSVDRMQRGLFGDWKGVGEGVFEMRLDFGPGYRLYYARQGTFVIVLLGGGDKGEQQKDIADAKRLWEGLKSGITQV